MNPVIVWWRGFGFVTSCVVELARPCYERSAQEQYKDGSIRCKQRNCRHDDTNFRPKIRLRLAGYYKPLQSSYFYFIFVS
uniref:AlNc14C85G5466 protein n=1 Tax=Albugo laibachii Nc14 TaxID=890382 RepID=F0WFT1_9STRA|nr:AlNc14C85G5466 [Albugo laibachii Nc14]|eukprot:CCA20065.1 AlNc14C85G5466 [Albugo laibachii Nc14]